MSGKIWSSVEIGAAIKRRRQELALTQEALAVRLDVSYQQIQRYESGKNKLNVENLQLIADALCVPISYFFHIPVQEKETPEDPACREQELLVQFRSIREEHLKEMVVNLSRLAAKG